MSVFQKLNAQCKLCHSGDDEDETWESLVMRVGVTADVEEVVGDDYDDLAAAVAAAEA